MDSLRRISFILCSCFCGISLFAQNITDLSVMNEEKETVAVGVSDNRSTINDSVFLHPDRIRYDSRCIQIDGKDVFVFSGTFHYFRTPQPLWENRLRKLKEAGFNCVETYIPWNWHERTMPKSPEDYSCLDMKPLVDFLNLTEQLGLYVIFRPGPYICAEWSGGGFPQWIMQKKPVKPQFDTWLQSTDPEFMKWNEHWYKAVCQVVEPYQVMHREKGTGGVILFQIENEFNRIKWFPKESKREYLVKLAEIVRQNGIEIPLITCWTDEARNVENGLLNGVVDMVNSYPKWKVEGGFGRLINQQLKTQPGKPLISGELQGGWMSEVGGKLSWEQDGLAPVQTQNITLYALQRGFCALNFYMAVGGTNLDDWGARQMTTTYDYAAAIGENGLTNERYRRFQGLAAFVKEHGTRIARAMVKDIPYVSSDNEVKMAVRETASGDRYYFVRTEEHSRNHWGSIFTEGLVLDFALEPFGAMVYYLPAGKKTGKWYPELPQPSSRCYIKADMIQLGASVGVCDLLPKKWNSLKAGEYVDDKGIYGRHFIYYKCQAQEGKILNVGRIGHKLINGTDKDEVLVRVNGNLLPVLKEDATSVSFQLPGDSLSGKQVEAILLFESKGLHHHTKKEVEEYWNIGPDFVRCEGKDLKVQYAYTEEQRGKAVSAGKMDIKDISDAVGKGTPLLLWHNFSFTLSDKKVVYELDIEHEGNGFIYLNGHCLGRCWEAGPQKKYYLPECWLNYGSENRIVVSMRPGLHGASVRSASLIPVW